MLPPVRAQCPRSVDQSNGCVTETTSTIGQRGKDVCKCECFGRQCLLFSTQSGARKKTRAERKRRALADTASSPFFRQQNKTNTNQTIVLPSNKTPASSPGSRWPLSLLTVEAALTAVPRLQEEEGGWLSLLLLLLRGRRLSQASLRRRRAGLLPLLFLLLNSRRRSSKIASSRRRHRWGSRRRCAPPSRSPRR